ncbi:MAG TPA: SprT-like domain-containing protein [Terriglobia bacterium]|nr:SprT-like domain-containing protein [Terriglobia bacterium]
MRTEQAEQLALPLGPPPDLTEVFRRVFSRLRIKSSVVSISARFHPFAGLRSTITVRNGAVRARVSDLLAEASPLVLEALAEILLARIFHRRPSREARECYLAYTFRPAIRSRIDAARRERGSKRLLPPRGRHHDLEEIFHALNHRFFRGQIPPSRLGWSHNSSRRVLGHYDSGHGTIIVSRKLDSLLVPRYVVEYVVFHEMLHIRFPVERRGHRRVVHSREFRAAEKEFPKYESACRQIKLLCA